MDTSKRWFAVQVRPKAEKVISCSLAVKGYECFLPTYWQKRRWSDRVVDTEWPLFPRYLFCRMDTTHLSQASRIVDTPGVTRIVSFGGPPVPVADSEIEALQKLMNSSLAREPLAYLPLGTRVRVKSGPLAGVEGLVLPGGNLNKIVLSVQFLNRSVSVSFDGATDLEVLDASGPRGLISAVPGTAIHRCV